MEQKPEIFLGEGETLHEECGVIAVLSPDGDAEVLTHWGLGELQHRGEEAAGIAAVVTTRNPETHIYEPNIRLRKGVGRVSDVFRSARDFEDVRGADLAIGQVRYSTSASLLPEIDMAVLAQPVHKLTKSGDSFSLAHNGNISNMDTIIRDNIGNGLTESSWYDTDSESVAELIRFSMETKGIDLKKALLEVVESLEGAYSFVLLTTDKIIGVRDPNGIRPLNIGVLPNGGKVIASERAALDIIGAEFTREIQPGEMVEIDLDGNETSTQICDPEDVDLKVCVFEFVYFSRPDNEINGVSVKDARVNMGKLLAERAPVDADLVMPLPDSGNFAAEGYALASGVPLIPGMRKNKGFGRSFIAPDQATREEIAYSKQTIFPEVVAGKRIIVVDDSIVRGTTTRIQVERLFEAGALEVHLRIASPPIAWPCFHGVDMPERSELLAAYRTPKEILEFSGATSLEYLPLEVRGLREAIGPIAGKQICDACITGNYPTPVKLEPVRIDFSKEPTSIS